MKAREFWIRIGRTKRAIYQAFTMKPVLEAYETAIHVREVVPIDWGQLWIDYHKAQKLPLLQANREIIQRLVERQLKGEE